MNRSLAFRLGIALITLVVVSILLVVLGGGAHAAAGCSSRSKSYSYKLAGIKIWTIKMTASGCWNARNTKVTSFHAGGGGSAVTPYQFDGVVGQQPVGGVGQHQAGMILTYKIEQCVPFVGCSAVAYPEARMILDSYGNWDIRVPF